MCHEKGGLKEPPWHRTHTRCAAVPPIRRKLSVGAACFADGETSSISQQLSIRLRVVALAPWR